MPRRVFVPVPGVNPEGVKLSHVHGAVSRWFDESETEHTAPEKPYTLSPLGEGSAGEVGVEVATLNERAAGQLAEAAVAGARIRLGGQVRALGRPYLMHRASWAELAAGPVGSRWRLNVVTPATFRRGDRTSPLPHPPKILESLGRAWAAWSDVALPGPGVKAACEAVWVSELDLRSDVLRLPVRSRHPDGPVDVTVAGVIGSLVLRCDDPDAARSAGPLIRLAAYAGLGSMTRKGLGVTRVGVDRFAAGIAGGGRDPGGAAV